MNSKIEKMWGKDVLAKGWLVVAGVLIDNQRKLKIDPDQFSLITFILRCQTDTFSPAVSYIEDHILMSESTIHRRIKGLEELGYLKVVRKENAGRNEFNRYDFSGLFEALDAVVKEKTITLRPTNIAHKAITNKRVKIRKEKMTIRATKAKAAEEMAKLLVNPVYETTSTPVVEAVEPEIEETPVKKEISRVQTWEDLKSFADDCGFTKEMFDSMDSSTRKTLCEDHVGALYYQEMLMRNFKQSFLEKQAKLAEQIRAAKEAERLNNSAHPYIGKAVYTKYDNEEQDEEEFLAEKETKALDTSPQLKVSSPYFNASERKF